MNPISTLLALLPQPYRSIAECVIALIGIASMIVAVLPASASKSPVVRAIRVVSALVHSDEPGTLKIPFTSIVLRVTPAPVVQLSSVPKDGAK